MPIDPVTRTTLLIAYRHLVESLAELADALNRIPTSRVSPRHWRLIVDAFDAHKRDCADFRTIILAAEPGQDGDDSQRIIQELMLRVPSGEAATVQRAYFDEWHRRGKC
jgi:hypothetical protein